MDELNWVRVLECDSEQQARWLEGVLKEQQIRCIVTGTEVSALGEALDGPDVIQLLVEQAQAEAAQELVDELLAEDDDPIPAWTCQCGESVDEGFAICWSCQASFDGQTES